jgi:chromosome segregation ATPase
MGLLRPHDALSNKHMDDTEVSKDTLMQSLAEMDASPTPEAATEAPEVKQEAKPVAKAESAAKDTTTDHKPADKADKAKDAVKPTDAKEQSKWAQNEARKAKTWQEINAEKDALKAERDKLAAERAEVQTRKAAAEVFRDEHGATAKDYRDAAVRLREAGDSKHADAAEKLAAQLDYQAAQARQHQTAETNKAQWIANFNALAEKNPDLKDPNSEISKAAIAVLKEFPLLTQDPKGITYAIRAAEIELKAKTFDGTKADYDKLKADYDKLQKKLTISGGSPTETLPADKPFSGLSLKEQRGRLEQMAEQHDRESGLS